VKGFGVLAEGKQAAVEGAGPYVFSRLAPSDVALDGDGATASIRYLNDCPQRNVVFMHSSVRLMGSLCHSAARNAISSVLRSN
jgi:hypothetical protein